MNSTSDQKPRSTSPRFILGQVLLTPGVKDLLAQLRDPWPAATLHSLLARHAAGEWGDVCPEDADENEIALREGFRVMSVYLICGERVWVITEADRNSTTLLLPEEY